MGEEPAIKGPPSLSVRRLIWREARQQAAYLAVTLAILAGIALLLGAIAAGLQARRDEVRTADVALIIAPAVPPADLVEHSFDLYRRGYVPRLLLLGEGQAALRDQLAERGIPAEGFARLGAEGVTSADLRRIALEAQGGGASSMLVVADPADLLRILKIVRDRGLRAYAAPVVAQLPQPLGLLEASSRYWRYVLLGL